MKQHLSLLLTVILFWSCNRVKDWVPWPRAPQINRLYGGSNSDEAYSIIQNTDGGFVLAGSVQSSDGDVIGYKGNGDAWVVRLNKEGGIQWQKTLGGAGVDRATDLTRSFDGGYLIAGWTTTHEGSSGGLKGRNDMDFWLVKLDKNGMQQWQKTYGGTKDDVANSIVASFDGGFVLAGFTQSNNGDVSGNHGAPDAWVLKIDGAGNKQWQLAVGGSAADIAFAVTTTIDGGYVVAGQTQSDDGDVTGFHGGYSDAWAFKVDRNGKLIWQKALGGSSFDYATALATSADGGYVLAASATSNDGDVTGLHGSSDIWVVKLDGKGKMQWQKALGGTDDEVPFSITQGFDGGFVTVGQTNSNNGDVNGNKGTADAWVVKLDRHGRKQWQKSLGGAQIDDPYCVIPNFYGGYVIAGQTQSNDGDVQGNHGAADAWVITIKER